MKVGLDKEIILKAAADMADEIGIANVTLKELARKLGVKSPSLYKHINGLDELKEGLMLYGWRALEEKMIRSAVGKSKDDAIRAIFYGYRDYVLEHPGVFEAMQWYNMYKSEENLSATKEIVEVLFEVLDAYELAEQQKVHVVRMFRVFLQGFMTVEIHGGFGNPIDIIESFDFALDILLKGIRNLSDIYGE